ncbi:MAG: hypothetical protein ACXVBO_18870, partial [Isosphaeraceae bacterium]
TVLPSPSPRPRRIHCPTIASSSPSSRAIAAPAAHPRRRHHRDSTHSTSSATTASTATSHPMWLIPLAKLEAPGRIEGWAIVDAPHVQARGGRRADRAQRG